MKTFENYFVFIIFALKTTLADIDDDNPKFYNRMLELHNIKRKLHNASPLDLDNKLSIEAMKIAEHWISTNENSISENEIFGCNFYSVRLINSIESVKLYPYTVFEYWYHIPERYNYTKEPKSRKFDAFTQIVWKNTTNLGVAKLEKDGKSVVVATYSPPGNIKGQYVENVKIKH